MQASRGDCQTFNLCHYSSAGCISKFWAVMIRRGAQCAPIVGQRSAVGRTLCAPTRLDQRFELHPRLPAGLTLAGQVS